MFTVIENWCKTLWGRGYKQQRINSLRIERRFMWIAMALKIEERLSCLTGTHLLHKSVKCRSIFGFLEAAFVSARRLLLVLVVPAVDPVGSEIPVPEIP